MKPVRLLAVLALFPLLFVPISRGQEKPKEIEVHDNVQLIEGVIPEDISGQFKEDYLAFLPGFEEVVSELTTNEEPDCALTIRVEPLIKEVGSKKTPRIAARVSAFRKGATNEYVAELILYSYMTAGPVNKEEITDFLKTRILDYAMCNPKE